MMSSKSTQHTEELQMALENIKQIRERLRDIDQNDPIRVMLLPLLKLGLVFSPLVIAFGVLSQQVLDSPTKLVLGQPKSTVIIGLTIGIVLLIGMIKSIVFQSLAKRHGYKYSVIVKALFNTGYPRIFIPVMTIFISICSILIQTGQPEHIVSFLLMMVGTVWMAIPLVFPIPDVGQIGPVLLVLGVLSLFVFPMFPFYKIALCFGAATAWIGISAVRASKKTE